MEEQEQKVIEISPLSKGKRFLLFLGDFFIAFIIAFTLFNLATFPLTKLIFKTDDPVKEFEKLCQNENIKAYLDANSAFSNMINQVNSIIGYFVKGGDEGGCSGNCSSCGGCH